MVINRDKHNLFTVKPSLNVTPQTDTDSSQGSSSSDGTTVIIGGGGSGLTQEQLDKLNSVEAGAQVNQDAFSYYKVSDGTNTATQAAITQKDTANLTVVGINGISAVLVTKVELAEAQFTSTGTNTGVYSIKYVPVTVEVPPTEEGGEPTAQTTYPLVFTYVSGDKLAIGSFDTIHLYKNEVEANSFTTGQYTVDSDTEGINSITIEQQGLDFDRIVFTLTATDAETQEQITTEVLVFEAATYTECIIQVQSDTGAYWQLDDEGNLYTTYNAYSTQELSAYGLGETGGGGTGGESYLKDLKDVDVTNLINGGILQYNSTTQMWEVVDGSSLEVDMTEIEQKITTLEGKVTTIETTITNWTPIIEAIDNITDWFSFVDGKIRANYDLWGVGEISAYGIGESGGSTGVSWLRDLEDVTLDPVIGTGDLLSYNGSVWVNIDKSEVGLNETELHNYLTQNNYATEDYIDSKLDNYATVAQFNTLQATVNNHTTQINSIQSAVDLLNDMFEWDNGKIKAKADFYGIGEVSAYGIGEGSGSQGTSYLHELQDVSVVLNELTQGQLLSWDDTINKWVAVDKDEVGLNQTELANYLTTNNYAKKTDITWNNVQNKPETFHTTLSYINDLHADWDNILNTSPTDYVTRWPTFAEVTDKPTTLAGYGITDAYTQTEADGRYVNVTGDTMTGNLILPTLQANTSIILGSVKLEYDSTSNALKVSNIDSNEVINLYATGEVSAYGYSEDTPITGAQNLDDLDDVIISSATTGQALIFNGTNWVNQTIETGGLDEAELEQYLQDNNYIQNSDLSSYATMTWVNNNFLQSSDLSGYAKSVYVNGSSYTANSSGRITIPDYITRYSVDSDGTQVISTGLRLKDGSNYGQYLYFGDGSYVYLAELEDDDLTIHATDLNLDVDHLYLNGTEIKASSVTVNTGTSGKLAYYSSTSTIDDYTSTVGSGTRLWYLNAGAPTNSSSTIGSSTSPVYLSSGTITACSYDLGANINSGSSGRLAYYSSSTSIDDYSSTIGSSTRLWYLSSGTPTNSSSSVGSSSQPVYLSNGTITATTASFLTTSNYTSTLDGKYVKKTGDTMTGSLTISSGEIYLSSGWFRNSAVNQGLYNVAKDKRWYANSAGYWYGDAPVQADAFLCTVPSTGVWLGSSAANGKFMYNSDTSATYLQGPSNGKLKFTGLTSSRLSELTFYTAAINLSNTSTTYMYLNLGDITTIDGSTYYILLSKAYYSGSAIDGGSCIGWIIADRGSSSTWNGKTIIEVAVGGDYKTNVAGFRTLGSSWAPNSMCVVRYNSAYYIALKGSASSSYNFYFIGRTDMKPIPLKASSVTEISTIPNASSYFGGNVISRGEITAYQTSDLRLKTNIQKLNAIDVVRRMNIVEYDWTDKALELKADKHIHDYGLIAQEVEELIPEVVNNGMYGEYKGINYNRLVPFALSAIQEVDDEVSMLKRRVTELEDRLSKYESIN